jgi:hypothetical protein
MRFRGHVRFGGGSTEPPHFTKRSNTYRRRRSRGEARRNVRRNSRRRLPADRLRQRSALFFVRTALSRGRDSERDRSLHRRSIDLSTIRCFVLDPARRYGKLSVVDVMCSPRPGPWLVPGPHPGFPARAPNASRRLYVLRRRLLSRRQVFCAVKSQERRAKSHRASVISQCPATLP